jgi:hypothetical protein
MPTRPTRETALAGKDSLPPAAGNLLADSLAPDGRPIYPLPPDDYVRQRTYPRPATGRGDR